MAASDDAQDETLSNLQEHRTLLYKLEKKLSVDPSNEENLKMQSDLKQLISFEEELCRVKFGYIPKPTNSVTDDRAAAMRRWSVGDRCIALWTEDQQWYLARIDEIHVGKGDGPAVYMVLFLEYGNTAAVYEAGLQSYIPATIEQLKLGVAVRAMATDGMFYPGEIVEAPEKSGSIAATTSWVKFKGHKKKQEISVYDILVSDVQPEKDPVAQAAATATDKIVIPDQLKIQPGDSEHIVRQKKIRIKHIKQDFKKRQIDQVMNEKQSSWTNFQKGIEKKVGKKHKSIFESTIEGTVGVTGSGKPLTAFVDHSKHLFAASAVSAAAARQMPVFED